MDRALLVGIDAYNAPNVPPINGCVNDVQLIQQTLITAAGFDPGSIGTLTDGQATRAAILSGLQALTTGLASGDRAVFHYSGHGTSLLINGLNHDAIIPIDFTFPSNNAIIDDDFANVFGAIPAGSSFVWISDSCDSGSLTRALAPAVRAGSTSRYLNPSAAVFNQLTSAGINPGARMRGLANTLNLVMWAACQDDEEAWGAPVNGVAHGMLSYYLATALNNVATRYDSAANLEGIIGPQITALYSGQHPELRGSPALFAQPFLPRLV